MKNKMLALLLGLCVSTQSISFTSISHAEEPLKEIKVCFDKYYYDAKDVTEITLTEGETVQLVLPESEPDMSEIYYTSFYTSEQDAAVTQDLKLTGLSAGEEHISIYISYKGVPNQKIVTIKANILRNDSISAETRKELERLENLDGFYRRRMELLGVIDENAPRLTMDKVQEIIDTSKDYYEIFAKLNEYNIIADQKPDGGNSDFFYWLDDKGNESITWNEGHYVFYTKTNDKGINEAGQFLYPEKSELFEGGDINYYYTQYNQIKPKLEGYGTLNLKFIDESTDEPFTETNGTFQLIYNNDKGDIEIVKSWDSSEGSEITISELSRDYTYELRYIDKYHGEYPEEYKYEVSLEKGKRFFSFADDSELSCDIYLKKHILGEPYLLGDVNNDKMINVADAVTLQKWLMGKPNTVLMNWKAADLCRDDELNIFDLCLMKNKLIKTTAD